MRAQFIAQKRCSSEAACPVTIAGSTKTRRVGYQGQESVSKSTCRGVSFELCYVLVCTYVVAAWSVIPWAAILASKEPLPRLKFPTGREPGDAGLRYPSTNKQASDEREGATEM